MANSASSRSHGLWFAPVMALGTGLLALPAFAATVPYSQSFNDSSFIGATPTLILGFGSTIDSASSELWANTNYYALNLDSSGSVNGWTFKPGAYYAVQTNADGSLPSTFNGGVLLNESSNLGPSSIISPLAQMDVSTTLATVIGQQYTVSTNYFGDNRPGQSYSLDLYLNTAKVYSLTGTDGAAGSLVTPHTLSYTFTATSTSTTVGFGQSASQGGASPIIDNLSVTAVPLPGAGWLLGTALFGLVGISRRRSLG